MKSAITNTRAAEDGVESLGRLDYFSGLFDLSYRLGPLNVSQSLDESEFIKLLNDRKGAEASLNGLLPLMPIVPPVSEILREWVDEWLDAGRDSNGVESPAERHFNNEGKVSSVVFEYSKRNRISLLGTSNTIELWFSRYETINGRPRFLGVRNEDIAREKLVFFLLSELRFKLAKCRRDGCGKYFALKHWKRTYKRGTLCPDCQRTRSQESARKATAEDRIEAGWKLCHLAAKKFAKQVQRSPDWHKEAPLRASLLKYLNAQIERVDVLRAVYWRGPRKGITGKWLSRASNWKVIEAIVKGEI
jgi:hypothetical protein